MNQNFAMYFSNCLSSTLLFHVILLNVHDVPTVIFSMKNSQFFILVPVVTV
jgi:hypothetical protein